MSASSSLFPTDFYDGLQISDSDDDSAEYRIMPGSHRAEETKSDAEYVIPARRAVDANDDHFDEEYAVPDHVVDVPQALVAVNARLSDEEIESYIDRAAWRETKHYFKTYAIPDGAFQFFEDVVVFLDSGRFGLSSDPSFSRDEMLYAYGVYGGGFGFYYFLAELNAGASVLEALWGGMKFGFQYWFFYRLDKDFDVDWVSAKETIPNVAFVCLFMGMLCYLLDTIPDLAYAYLKSDEPELNAALKKELKKIARKNVGEAAGVAVGTAGWMLPYYLPWDNVAGYVAKGVGEGVFSNLCALYFVHRSARQDIQEEVENGARQPMTRAQEIEEENKPRVSFCTRASNYFRSWIFTDKKPVIAPAANREALLSDEERKEASEDLEYNVPSVPRSKSKSKLSSSKRHEVGREIELGSSSRKKSPGHR